MRKRKRKRGRERGREGHEEKIGRVEKGYYGGRVVVVFGSNCDIDGSNVYLFVVSIPRKLTITAFWRGIRAVQEVKGKNLFYQSPKPYIDNRNHPCRESGAVSKRKESISLVHPEHTYTVVSTLAEKSAPGAKEKNLSKSQSLRESFESSSKAANARTTVQRDPLNIRGTIIPEGELRISRSPGRVQQPHSERSFKGQSAYVVNCIGAIT